MKTKNNLIRSMFMNILTAGLFATTFTACSDELNVSEASDAPQIENNGLTNLEQYSYSVPVQVDVQGDWEIDLQFSDEERMFCYAIPSHGHGPATVKLCMLDNWTEERNEGKLIIRDLSGNSSKTLPITQKCNLDNPVFLNAMTRGDDSLSNKTPEGCSKIGERTSGVGYGYNITKKPGNDAISRNPIIMIEAVNETKGCGITYSEPSVQIRGEQYGASSISELAKKMEVSSDIKGSRGGFTAEAKATYSESQIENTSNMFGMGLIDVKVRSAYLEGIDYDNVRDFMTENAKKAIDGTGRSYPSTPAGFKRLIKDYGTHLIVKADLGGRLRYGTTCDKAICKNESEIKAMASCSYNNKIVEASCKASAEKKKLYESKKSHIKTTISAAGGDFELAAELYGEGNDTDANVKAWMKSLKEECNLAVVGFGQEDAIELWPLYELVDYEKYPARYEALKDYMENGMIQDDALDGTDTYSNRDIMKINIPSIDDLTSKYGKADNNSLSTLVYEVWDNNSGHMVAMICNEYIPQITTNGYVQTIYLVENGKPNFKVGRYVGSDNNLACDISWHENGTIKFENRAERKGRENTMYLLGSEFFTTGEITLSNDKYNIVECSIKGKFLEDQKVKSGISCVLGLGREECLDWSLNETWMKMLKYDNHKYPLVKIGTRIWTRENYSGRIPHGASEKDRYGTTITDGEAYFTNQSAEKLGCPTGWHVGKSTDYEILKTVVTSKVGSKNIGEIMQERGTTGFEMKWNGWYTYSVATQFGVKYYHGHSIKGYGSRHMEYMTSDGYHISIQDTKINLTKEKYDFAMNIRLVMD